MKSLAVRLEQNKVIEAIRTACWVLFLVALPVTSFPHYPPALGGGALVKPLSLYPLLVLIFLAILPALLRKPLPITLISLVPFLVIALASSLLSLLRDIDPILGISVADRLLRGLLTLAIGCLFYLAFLFVPRALKDLRQALRWIYIGFAIAMAWGSVQVIYVVHFNQTFYRLLSQMQRLISSRRLIQNRISGMTYEPNWFAEQIAMLLLPWLLASVIHGFSVFRWRWKWVTVEWLLLGWSILLLPFTFSRAGLANMFVLIVLSLLLYRLQPQQGRPFSRRLLRVALEAGAVLLLLVAFLFAAGSRNEFFSRLWSYWKRNETSLSDYFEYLGFGARFVYNETAFRTYEAYPIWGVGLGNYAFFFSEMLPDRSLAAMPEVLRLVTPAQDRDRLITSKNLYLRILAETGLLGFATFITFIFAIFGCALYLWLSPLPKQRFWGTGGLLGMVAFLISATSYDSFAIPNMWVTFGLITTAAWFFSRASQAYAAETTVEQDLFGEI